MVAPEISRAERARARGRAYELLARLIGGGARAEVASAVAEIPMLAAWAEGFSPQELAAAHYRLFGTEVPPYAGSFSAADGLVGGEAADRVIAFATESGMRCAPAAETPDHLAVVLSMLALSCQAEADALEVGDGGATSHARTLERRALDELLLPWLAPLDAAVSMAADGFWRRAWTLLCELLAEHGSELGLAEPGRREASDEPRDWLDDGAGIERLAERLCLPAWSGVWLGRSEIRALARACQLPCGFGDRRRMLANLLHGAAEYGRAQKVLMALRQRIAAHVEAMQARGRKAPALTRWASPWLGRARACTEALAHMAEALSAPAAVLPAAPRR